MDELAKIMARGLIALPSDVRKRLGLKEGDLVRIEVKEDHLVIKKGTKSLRPKGYPPGKRSSRQELCADIG